MSKTPCSLDSDTQTEVDRHDKCIQTESMQTNQTKSIQTNQTKSIQTNQTESIQTSQTGQESGCIKGKYGALSSITNLVFEGGGVKGIAFLGSLKYIEDQLPNIKRLAGTSVGAISAMLIAIGYSLTEVKNIIWSTDFRKFFDHEYDIPRDTCDIIMDYGSFSGDSFTEWVSDLINKKTGNPSYTLGDLWNEHGIDLVTVTSNVTKVNPEYLSYRNHPGMPIKDAVRMSMSIPIVFAPVKYQGCYYADGGLMDNYPIHVFDGKYPGDYDAINDRVPPNKATLGFRLMSDYDDTSSEESTKEFPIKSIISYSMAVFQGLMKSTAFQYNGDRNWSRSIQISTCGISALDFGLSTKQKETLFNNGFKAAEEFFEK